MIIMSKYAKVLSLLLHHYILVINHTVLKPLEYFFSLSAEVCSSHVVILTSGMSAEHLEMNSHFPHCTKVFQNSFLCIIPHFYLVLIIIRYA
jgi:hypothetical protein